MVCFAEIMQVADTGYICAQPKTNTAICSPPSLPVVAMLFTYDYLSEVDLAVGQLGWSNLHEDVHCGKFKSADDHGQLIGAGDLDVY